jgi:quinol monooxygenase YgiN
MDNTEISQVPYGALDYYQVHYIVETKYHVYDPSLFLARCYPITKGHLSNKRIVGTKWEGDRLADILRADVELEAIVKEILHEEGEIRVDPLEDHIRIYGKWRNEDQLKFSPKMFEAADRIAGYIKKLLNPTQY